MPSPLAAPPALRRRLGPLDGGRPAVVVGHGVGRPAGRPRGATGALVAQRPELVGEDGAAPRVGERRKRRVPRERRLEVVVRIVVAPHVVVDQLAEPLLAALAAPARVLGFTWIVRGQVAAPPRAPRGSSAARSRRRRGRHVDRPLTGRGGAAGPTSDADRPRRRRGGVAVAGRIAATGSRRRRNFRTPPRPRADRRGRDGAAAGREPDRRGLGTPPRPRAGSPGSGRRPLARGSRGEKKKRRRRETGRRPWRRTPRGPAARRRRSRAARGAS